MEPPPFAQSSSNCKWHNDIQSSLDEVKNLVRHHQQQELTEEQKKRNDELVQKFVCFKGQKGRMWKSIEKFYCKPSVFQMKDIQLHIEDDIKREKPGISAKDLKEKVLQLCNSIENEIREKYSHLPEEEINKKIKEVNVKGYLTGDREKYVSDKAEFLVEDAICKIMFDKPGLLRRGLKTAKVTYQHLKNILGEITPNCSDKNCKHHKPQCFQMEADLILIYPSEEKVNIILFEVKQSRSENLNSGLVTGAFRQLVRDVKFILSLMPDIHLDQVDIKTFAAFPETDIKGVFCDECKQHVLSQDDLNLGLEHLEKKLSISTETQNLNEANEVLMQTICARMIGNESYKNDFNVNKYFINYQETVDNLILFDEYQQKALNNFDEKRNFAFYGPFGSGKTSVAIKCCNKLIKKYSKDEQKTNIFVYAIVFDSTKEMKLINTLRENIHKKDNVTLRCETFSNLLSETNFGRGYLKKAVNFSSKVIFGDSIEKKIQAILRHLETKHSGHPCIFLFDEAQLLLSDFERFKWSDLSLNSSANHHVIFCFSPIQKYSGQYIQVELDDSYNSATFRSRYRNSQKIQQLCRFLSNSSSNSLIIEEEKNIPCLQGDQPVWIDIGDNHDLIMDAVRRLKTDTTKYPKQETLLLHDDTVNENILKRIKEAWGEHLPMCNWRNYVGCESDAVVYVSNGDGAEVVRSGASAFSIIVGVALCLGVALSAVVLTPVAGDVAVACLGAVVAGVVVAVVSGVVAVVGYGGGVVYGIVVGIVVVIVVGVVVGAGFGAGVVDGIGAGTVAGIGAGIGTTVFVVVTVLAPTYSAAIAGYHEAISRARHFIGIITVNNDGKLLGRSYKKLTDLLK